MTTVTKEYRDLPAAHRQPNHDGHCRLIHGHNWGFDITFACSVLDANGFVIDVGKLGCVKTFLVDTFDHTLLINHDDPFKPHFIETLGCATGGVSFAKLVVVPNCGMEGLAEYVFNAVSSMIGDAPDMLYDRDVATGGKRSLRVVSVTVHEDSKNCATYKAGR
jgi:6-pyruvoyltetrahydropterin/6-carboxytetrahydropterin synthase